MGTASVTGGERARSVTKTLREYVLHAVLLVALLVPVFPGVFLRGEVAISGNALYGTFPWRATMPSDLAPQQVNLETPRQVVAWYYLTREAMRDGELPLWNPYQFTGVPLIGAYQTAVFYPPRLIFLLIDDLFVALTVFILFKLWLAGFLAYLCARGLSLPARYARFFSIAYLLGGYMMTWCSYTTVDSMAWAPILFLGLEFVLQRRWLRGYAACTVSATMMTLAGGAQHTLTFSILLGLYFIARLPGLGSPRYALRAVGTAAAAASTAFLVSAIQLLPFLETLSQSLSALESVFSFDTTDYRYLITDAPIFWAPQYFGTYLHGNFWGRMNPFYLTMAYIGIPCWVGAALALRAPGMSSLTQARVRSLLLGGTVALWFAFGAPGSAVVTSIPGFKTVRLVYFMSFFAFSLPLLAAIGLRHYFSGGHHNGAMLVAILLTAAIVSVISLHLLQNHRSLAAMSTLLERRGTLVESLLVNGSPAFPFKPQGGSLDAFVTRQCAWTIALLFASIIGIGAARYTRIPPAVAMNALTALLVIDLWSAWHGLQPTSKRSVVFPPNELLTTLQAKGHPYRINFSAIADDGLCIPYGLEEQQGYDAMVPKRFWTTLSGGLDTPGLVALDRALATPVRLVFLPRDGNPVVPAGFEIEYIGDGLVVAADPESLPRARLAGATEVCDSQQSVINRMNEAGFDPRDLAVLEGPNAPTLTGTTSEPPGEAHITDWRWNSVTVATDASQEAVLVLAEAFYPGWEARIDGSQPAPIFPAYHVLRGVAVPAGKHTVEFRYRPLPFRIGAAASLLTLLVMFACGAWVLRGTLKS